MSATIDRRDTSGTTGSGRWSRIARLNPAPSLQFVLTIGDDHIPGIEPAANYSGIALREGYRDRAVLHGLVWIHGVNECTLRATKDGRGWDHDAVLARLQQEIGVDKLVRPKLVVSVAENSFELRRTGCGINLVVDREQLARRQLGLIVAAESIDFESSLLHALRHSWQYVLRQREDHGDRL